MTEQPFPFTPSQGLVQEWLCDDNYPCDSITNATISIAAGRLRNIATQAARWGADMELEACEEWIAVQLNCTDQEHLVPYLRAARRPKPSLTQRALHILGEHGDLSPAEHDAIRRALEQLPS